MSDRGRPLEPTDQNSQDLAMVVQRPLFAFETVAFGVLFGATLGVFALQLPFFLPLRMTLAIALFFGALRWSRRRIMGLSFVGPELRISLPFDAATYQCSDIAQFEVYPVYSNATARVKIVKRGSRWPHYYWVQNRVTSLGSFRQTVNALRRAGIARGLSSDTPRYGLLDVLYRPVRWKRSSGGPTTR